MLLISIMLPSEQIYSENRSQKYLDIPLSAYMQDYIMRQSDARGVDPNLVFAIMKVESNFNPNAVSKTNDFGLMQINKSNFGWLNITKPLDPKQNVNAGLYIIEDLSKKYDNEHQILMAYNMGSRGASKYWKRGVYESEYSRKVMAEYETIR